MELTTKDIKAMKTSDIFTFRAVNGRGTIECSKRADDKNPWDQRHIIDVPTNARNAFYTSISAQFDTGLCSIVHLLKPGMEVKLDWYKGAGDTEELKAQGFCCDSLSLTFNRGNKRLSFLVSWATTKQHNFRMVNEV